MTLTTISVHRAGTTLEVALNRPASRNAMNLAMCEELVATFESVLRESGNESDLRCVVLRAEGPSFCAGVDIRELQDWTADQVLARRNRGLDAFLAVERCPLPVIAAVHGAAFGAGAELASACDFVLAADTAVFQWPEALRGAVGATQRLPRAVGRSMAKELLFTARKIDVAEAKSIGLVNRVVPADALDAAVAETVLQIARCGPIAVRLIKQAINQGEHRDRGAAIALERELIAQSMLQDEWRAAVDDFRNNPRS